ncbi:MAG: hypothetical protein J1F43_04605 [Muribaculaceae bacterium]|nr:hypothetical protein [Muribaculaceae bacterium]
MYLSSETLTILSCLLLVLFGLMITLDLAFYSLDNLHSRENDNDFIPYLNHEGNHVYYERSLIEKKSFLKLFPGIKPRSFKNLFKKLFENL